MADRIDHLTERVQVVEIKVDSLSTTVGQLWTRVDSLSTTVNELSAAMAAGFVEQREYTEFSHARLEAKIDAGYTRLETKMDAGFAGVDRKLDQLIDAHRLRPKSKRRNE